MNQTYFKYETHLHTSEVSKCAVSGACELVNAYIDAGYAGIVVTDHFINGNTTVPGNLPWKEQVDLFCLGYENALREANNKNFQVFFGWEYSYNGADFLTYGLDKTFLIENPDVVTIDIERYFCTVHRNNGFIIHAHPFRQAPYIKSIVLYPQYIDAVEVHNGAHTDPEFDYQAKVYAGAYGLPETSGSDTHHVSGINGGGMAFDHRLESIEDLIGSIRKPGSYNLIEHGTIT